MRSAELYFCTHRYVARQVYDMCMCLMGCAISSHVVTSPLLRQLHTQHGLKTEVYQMTLPGGRKLTAVRCTNDVSNNLSCVLPFGEELYWAGSYYIDADFVAWHPIGHLNILQLTS